MLAFTVTNKNRYFLVLCIKPLSVTVPSVVQNYRHMWRQKEIFHTMEVDLHWY